MAASYAVYLKDVNGNMLAALTQFKSLYLMLSVGVVGNLALDIPYDTFDATFFDPDSILEVWRSVDGGLPYLVGGRLNFARVVTAQLGQDGQKLYHVEGRDTVDLLNRKIIPYNTGTAQASKTGPTDDVMKSYVNDNSGSGATDWLKQTGRSLTPWLGIQPNVSAAPSISKDAGSRSLLMTLQEAALSAYQAGTYTVFDVVSLVPPTGIGLEFRTYTQQRGADHRVISTTNKPVLLSAEDGNLVDLEFMKDWSGVINTTYCGPQGFYQDTAAASFSVFARTEDYINPLQSTSGSAQNAEAAQHVRDMRLKKTWSARFVDTPGVKFGRDLDFGDFCSARFGWETVDVRLDSLAITLAGGEERIDLLLRSDT